MPLKSATLNKGQLPSGSNFPEQTELLCVVPYHCYSKCLFIWACEEEEFQAFCHMGLGSFLVSSHFLES